ncbi:MAG TPA: DUF3151 domain-containing protein [Actinomycetes bacterium]|jgi:hypothetical protein|nr:DUF3151 domain-containing protein [Actinomycetes bacterium]
MTQLPISEPAQTTLTEPGGSLEALGAAIGVDEVSAVASHFPACLAAWATLGELALEAGHPVQAYAYFRVGYHRGLDRIRRAGWRGSGRVPWAHEGNRGFLRSLRGLQHAAAAIAEQDEAERCRDFLAELAPDAPQERRGSGTRR